MHHAPRTLVAPLLKWFSANARTLPWRGTLDPYAVWVSEIMLQQTQVKTVIPYYERWMRELPDVHALAKAPSEKIHKLWEGLGYYTRVRNMQKAAQAVVEKHGGIFPHNFDGVLALPGIGRYTAGAICSIAFNQPAPVLDGNVIRVLTRIFGIRENAREKETNARLWKLAEALVQAAERGSGQPCPQFLTEDTPTPDMAVRCSGACSALNQSLMELGALVCTPRQPRCEECPWAKRCVARRETITEQLPNLGARVPSTARRFVACVLEHDGALLVRQRPGGVVNAHLWEFPNVEVALDAPAEAIQQALAAELGSPLVTLTPLTTVKHSITRFRITLEAFRAEFSGTPLKRSAGTWVKNGAVNRLPFTSAQRKVLETFLR
jgi:A/G-specific adenine glycosylase